jgi:hypothetical protein
MCAAGAQSRNIRCGLTLTCMVTCFCRLRAALATPGSKASDRLRQLGITPTTSKHSGATPLSAPLLPLIAAKS